MCGRIISGILFFVIAVGFGYYVGSRSWGGQVIVSMSDLTDNSRVPAAIRKDLDFSRLDGADLITATQQRLVTAARVVLDPEKSGELGVELGHFVTRDDSGQRRLACDSFYNKLTLVFAADGIADGGERALMRVDGPCKTSTDDISSIEPIWIPFHRILKEHSTDMDLSYEENVTFKFENMGAQWPLHWSLQSVRLYNSELSGHEVFISSHEIHEIRHKPFVLNWQD